MGSSASRNARKVSAPVVNCSGVPAAALGAASTGSVASYAESSDARSAGTTGGLGVGGREYCFTTPTWASLAYAT